MEEGKEQVCVCVCKGVPGEADIAHTVSHVAVTGEAVLYAPLRCLTAALGPGQWEAPARRGVPPVSWVRRFAWFNQLKEFILTACSKLYCLTDMKKIRGGCSNLTSSSFHNSPPFYLAYLCLPDSWLSGGCSWSTAVQVPLSKHRPCCFTQGGQSLEAKHRQN